MEFEFVRKLDPFRNGQILDLYKTKEDRYFVLSTVVEIRTGDPIEDSFLNIASLLGPVMGEGDLPSSGEETGAFWADENGDMGAPIKGMRINGPQSRQLCLKKLKETTQGEL